MKVNFKTILAWVKSNLLIVIFSLLILVILPVSFFVSSSWLKSILTKQEKIGADEYNKIKGAQTITYTVPKYDANAGDSGYTGTPHAKVVQHYKRAREEFASKVEMLAKEGEDFNKGVGSKASEVGRGEHTPLVAGLFPKVAATEQQKANPGMLKDAEQAKINQMEDALLGKRGLVNPYEQMLRSVNAGGVADPATLTQTIRDTLERRKQEITSNNRALTQEEADGLRQQLVDRRLGAYQGRAGELGVYATLEVFPQDGQATEHQNPGGMGSEFGGPSWNTIVAGSIPPKRLRRDHLFMYQWDIWVLNDIFAAVRLANTGPDGKLLPIDKAVVKRIESIKIMTPEGMKPLDAVPGQEEIVPDGGTPPADPGANGALDKNASITGRVRSGSNPFFELRRVELRVVASSERINELQSAVAATNFMSITDLDMEMVDVWADLSQGYFYGNEHVLRATLQIETIWLKSWLLKYMPDEVKSALGIALPTESAAGAGGADGSNTG